MASIDWPWELAIIHAADYARGGAPSARETRYDDGLIRQEDITSAPMETRQFTVTVTHSNIDAFNAWRRSTGSKKFNFRDLDSPAATREVQIVGGYAGVTMRLIDGFEERYKGERIWRGRVELRGLW